jgi:hypothetical protein
VGGRAFAPRELPGFIIKGSVEMVTGLRHRKLVQTVHTVFPCMVFTGIVRRERMVRNSDPNPASELLVPVHAGSRPLHAERPISGALLPLSYC